MYRFFTLRAIAQNNLFFTRSLASTYYKKRELLSGGQDVGITVEFQLRDFFRGYLLYVPLLLIMLFIGVFTFIGFLFFVFPAVYIYFTLSFAPLVYIEYHKQKSEAGHFGIHYPLP